MLTWSFVKWNSIVTKKQKRILNEKGLLVGFWLLAVEWIGGIETHLTKSTLAILLCMRHVGQMHNTKISIQFFNIFQYQEELQVWDYFRGTMTYWANPAWAIGGNGVLWEVMSAIGCQCFCCRPILSTYLGWGAEERSAFHPDDGWVAAPGNCSLQRSEVRRCCSGAAVLQSWSHVTTHCCRDEVMESCLWHDTGEGSF